MNENNDCGDFFIWTWVPMWPSPCATIGVCESQTSDTVSVETKIVSADETPPPLPEEPKPIKWREFL